MKHIHHIIPKHMGGSDEPDNLIELTIEEHARAHKILYETYGKQEDYLAWKGLSGQIDKEEIIFSKCSIGGKIGGKKQAEMGIGFHQYKTNPELHKQWASKGGKTSGVFANSVYQSEFGKRGGVKNRGFIWINDGVKSYKYTSSQQKEKTLEFFLLENKKFNIGRLDNNFVTCPHCGKYGKVGGMKLHHFDNCGRKRTFKITKKKCHHCGKIGAGGAMTRFHFDNCKSIKGKN